MAKLIQQMLREAILTNPERIAIEKAPDTFITYKELHNRAGKIASYLKKQGLMPGKGIPVAILMEQDTPYIEAMVACMLFGYSAVLLNKTYPKERCDYVVGDSGARIILEEKNIVEAYQDDTVCDSVRVESDTSAIIVYTSGSTGKPKGVIHSNRFYDSEGVCDEAYKSGQIWFLSTFYFCSAWHGNLFASLLWQHTGIYSTNHGKRPGSSSTFPQGT